MTIEWFELMLIDRRGKTSVNCVTFVKVQQVCLEAEFMQINVQFILSYSPLV